MTGSIQKSYLFFVMGYFIGADMLGNAAKLTFHHVALANIIEQCRFSMVDVAQDTDNRRSRFQQLGLVDFLNFFLGWGRLVFTPVFYLEQEAMFFGQFSRNFLFDHLVSWRKKCPTP